MKVKPLVFCRLFSHQCQKTREKYKPLMGLIFFILYSTIDQQMKRSAITVIADATFRNQPPNCRQNSDPGMWRSAANFTLPCNFQIYLWSRNVALQDHCYSAWSALLQIQLKPWAGLILNATSQDQFAEERYVRYNSDPVAPHSEITGIADIALHYHTIWSGRHIIQTRLSYKFIKPLRNVYSNLKGQGPLNLNKNIKRLIGKT
jgi:hypothetical protein